MNILKDICDDPDSDFCWNKQQAGKISVYNSHVSPFWDYAREIGFQPALLEFAYLSHDWHDHARRCMVKIESMIKTIPQGSICLVCDDFGTSTGSMVSAKTFEQVYLPLLKEFKLLCYLREVCPAWHSCGNLFDLVPILKESGIDVLWLDEIHLMGAARVRKALNPWQTLWFHPRSAHDLIDAQPAWAIYNITASELRGNVEWQKSEFRRIVREAEDGRQG